MRHLINISQSRLKEMTCMNFACYIPCIVLYNEVNSIVMLSVFMRDNAKYTLRSTIKGSPVLKQVSHSAAVHEDAKRTWSSLIGQLCDRLLP